MIELKNLSKEYKDKRAVDELSLIIRPGVITGLLGPNGAGKSTMMKMILSLTKATQGEVTVDGVNYEKLNQPIKSVGTLIDTDAVDPKFTAKQHLELVTTASGISRERTKEVLKQTGLEKVENKQIGEFSLGMKQRLGIAVALIGDPGTIILDEPFNGLDVDGIKWLRKLLKDLAGQGKAILISSHLMSEIQAIAERIVVLAQGKLIADMTIEEMAANSLGEYIKVKSENNKKLHSLLIEQDSLAKLVNSNEEVHVHQLTMKQIGMIAKENNLAIYELSQVEPSLEDLFMELTEGKMDYVSGRDTADKEEVLN